MNIKRVFSYALILSINFACLSLLFFVTYLLLPEYTQEIFYDSFQYQKKLLIRSLHRIDRRKKNTPEQDIEEEIVKHRLPMLKRSSYLLNSYLVIRKIFRTIIGVFEAVFYGFKAVLKLILRSFMSTVKYAILRIKLVDKIIVKYVVKILKFTVLIVRALTFVFRLISNIIVKTYFQLVPEDTAENPFGEFSNYKLN